jgi:thiamine biosynthesis lipoprotein
MMPSLSISVFRAMEVQCRIVASERGLAAVGEEMVRDLERRWSRFDPLSEVRALNEPEGGLAIVSADTYELVSCSEQARHATHGAFNPLVVGPIDPFGGRVARKIDGEATGNAPALRSASREPIELIPEIRGVRLPEGTRFDPGGIGKGLAADLVTARLHELGATTTEVVLGSDVRVRGPEWTGGTWAVRVGGRRGSSDAASFSLPEGGVSTRRSSRGSLRGGDLRLPGSIEPPTGLQSDTDLGAATVVASTLWWAEAVAKAVVGSGRRPGRELLEGLGVNGVLESWEGAPRYDVIVTPLMLT